jgi:hypothetical protein
MNDKAVLSTCQDISEFMANNNEEMFNSLTILLGFCGHDEEPYPLKYMAKNSRSMVKMYKELARLLNLYVEGLEDE